MDASTEDPSGPASGPASGPTSGSAVASLEYWRRRKAEGLAQARILPLAAELGAGINWLAISAILLLGDLFEGLSPFQGVSLRAAGDDALVAPRAPQPYRRVEELYERLDEIVRGAIRRLPAHMPTALGLSGGRDSRHILFAHLAEGRPPPRLVTARHFIPGLSERDLAAAQLVAARLGAARLGGAHTVVDQPRDRFHPEWDKNLLTGLQNPDHSWGIALAGALDPSEVLYDGMNGGAILGRGRIILALVRGHETQQRPSFSEMRRRLLAWLVDQPAERLRPWAPPRLISPPVLQTLRDLLFASFSRYESFINPLLAFWHDQHVRRHTPIFTFGMMPNEVVVCPFDTPEMLHFAYSLPWEVSCDARLADNALAHCYPQYADLPYGGDLAPPPPAWSPDAQRETASWQRLRPLLAPRLSPAGLAYLDKTRHQLKEIQWATLLAQAYFWDENGYLPDAAAFFDPQGAQLFGGGSSRICAERG